MTASEVLRAAQAAGVRFLVEGLDLVLDADTPPPDDLMAAIKLHKPEIISLLAASSEAALTDAQIPHEGLQVLNVDTLRRWFVVEPSGLEGERILIVSAQKLEEEAREAHPGLVVYMPWEVRSLLDREVPTAFAMRIHMVKRMFDGVIVPERGGVK